MGFKIAEKDKRLFNYGIYVSFLQFRQENSATISLKDGVYVPHSRF